MMEHQLPVALLHHLQNDQQQSPQQSLVRYTLYLSLVYLTCMLATKPMSVKVQFEFGRYAVQESCTLLPVILVAKGEVLRNFTVSVKPSMGLHPLSAEGV